MRLMPPLIFPARVRFLMRAFGMVLLIVSAVSCRKHSTNNRNPSTEEPRTVQTMSATLRPMEKLLTVTGTLAAQEDATLSVKVPGRLEKIAVDLGSAVKRDDLIAQVERRDYELR